jgi:hypothetical protein
VLVPGRGPGRPIASARALPRRAGWRLLTCRIRACCVTSTAPPITRRRVGRCKSVRSRKWGGVCMRQVDRRGLVRHSSPAFRLSCTLLLFVGVAVLCFVQTSHVKHVVPPCASASRAHSTHAYSAPLRPGCRIGYHPARCVPLVTVEYKRLTVSQNLLRKQLRMSQRNSGRTMLCERAMAGTSTVATPV